MTKVLKPKSTFKIAEVQNVPLEVSGNIYVFFSPQDYYFLVFQWAYLRFNVLVGQYSASPVAFTIQQELEYFL